MKQVLRNSSPYILSDVTFESSIATRLILNMSSRSLFLAGLF